MHMQKSSAWYYLVSVMYIKLIWTNKTKIIQYRYQDGFSFPDLVPFSLAEREFKTKKRGKINRKMEVIDSKEKEKSSIFTFIDKQTKKNKGFN